MRHAIVGIALFAGCTSDKDGTGAADTDDDPGIETADTATEPEPDLTGNDGSIALVHVAADAYSEDPYYVGIGLFVTDDQGIDNLAACVFGFSGCYDEYPELGQPAVGVATFDPISVNDIYDVGDLTVGGIAYPMNRNNGYPLHVGTLTSLGDAGGVSLDGDYAPYSGTDDYVVPDEIVVTSPDPMTTIQVTTGSTIDLAWTSPGAGGVYLEITSGVDALLPDTVVRLDDDGAHTVAVDDLEFRPPFEDKTLVLSRIETSEVDAAGNTLQVHARSDQRLYVEFTDTTGWTELVAGATVGETCTDALALPALAPGQYYGDLSTYADDHDLGEDNPKTGWPTLGLDGVVPVTLVAGQTLTARVRQVLDASIYLLDSGCQEADALEGADSTAFGGEEELVYTATADGTYYLVLDTYTEDEGSKFSLVLEVE